MEQLAQKILETGKITKSDLDEKVKNKLTSLGGLISEEGALHIIANELGVALTTALPSDVKVKDITAGMRNVNVLIKILKKYELRTFGPDGTGKVASCYVADETASSRLTFWNEKTSLFEQLNEGDVVEVQQAYSRENNGRVEIHMGNSSHCLINPEGKTIEVQATAPSESPEKKLQEITEKDTFVSITATIVQAYDPRFFPVDPTSNKRVPEDQLKGDETYNYVMNVFLDDSSHNMRATLWKEQIQQLLNMTNEEIIAIKDDTSKIEEIKTDLLGRIISARAKIKKNEAYNNIELVLYNVNPHPKAPSSTTKSESVSATLVSNAEASKTPVEKPLEKTPEANIVAEEILGDDDEELLSIDDIDDQL